MAPKKPAAADDAVAPRARMHKLTIRNFRAIGKQPVEIELDDIVVLVGANNTGKSSILRAYELVMDAGKKGEMVIDDFPGGTIPEGGLSADALSTAFDARLPFQLPVQVPPSRPATWPP
ncbi:AAA family ATPase [Dyella solisilvae]|uniref:AAA family ATPase n=1 Tax=Dyella solisilvae TaxID=1920168 RepID=UPI001F465EF1|nr:AAA family ATPase [Dyella solisilvae]